MSQVPAIPTVEIAFTVHTYDIDFANIVSNIVYIRWLEDLRLAMLDRYLPLQAQLAEERTPVLLHTDIRYLHAIRLFEHPVGRMWLAGVGRVRWTVAAKFLVDGIVAATAQQELATVHLKTFRPQPTSPELRSLLEET